MADMLQSENWVKTDQNKGIRGYYVKSIKGRNSEMTCSIMNGFICHLS